MRYRMGMAALTGLGNPSKELINGIPSKNKKLNALVNKASKEAYELFFKYFGHCDAQIARGEIIIGVEPAYMYEDLKIIRIDFDKELSSFQTGYAFGGWGSGIRSTTRYYKEYKYTSKFIKFIDKWHPVLFKQYKNNNIKI